MSTATAQYVEVETLRGSPLSTRLAVPATLRFLPDGVPPAPGERVFRVLNRADGDKRIVWGGTFAEIRDAKRMFLDFVKEGLKPYRVDPTGKASAEAMTEFDPAAGEVIFLPTAMIAGG